MELVVKLAEVPRGFRGKRVVPAHWEAQVVEGMEPFVVWGVSRDHAMKALIGHLKAEGLTGNIRLARTAPATPVLPTPVPVAVAPDQAPTLVPVPAPEVLRRVLWQDLAGNTLKGVRLLPVVMPGAQVWDATTVLVVQKNGETFEVAGFPWEQVQAARPKPGLVAVCKANRVFIDGLMALVPNPAPVHAGAV